MKVNTMVKNRGGKKINVGEISVFPEDGKWKWAKETTVQNKGLCTGENCTVLLHAAHQDPRGCKFRVGRSDQKCQKWGFIEGWYTEQLTVDFLPGIVKYSLAFTHKHKQTNKIYNKEC